MILLRMRGSRMRRSPHSRQGMPGSFLSYMSAIRSKQVSVRGKIAMADEEVISTPILPFTGKIVAAYVRNNPVPASGFRGVIEGVHSALKDISSGMLIGAGNAKKPAVPVKKSVTPAYIVCLEDGRKLKMLKRYLRTRYGLSPEAYRMKWRLAPNYPMVAPEYAERRSAFAKKIGLGRTRPVANKRRKRA